MTIDWVAHRCTTGSGTGKDQNGATFRLVFGFDEAEAQAALDKLSASVDKKPKLPVYKPKEFGRIYALSGIQGDIRLLHVDVPIQPGNLAILHSIAVGM